MSACQAPGGYYERLTVSRRSQLLEILMDINNAKQVPPRYRFDVSTKNSPERSPRAYYRKPEGASGEIKLHELEQNVAYTAYDLVAKDDTFPAELEDQEGHAPYGYLTPKHEEEYLAVIDNALDVIPLPSASRPNTIIDPSVDLRPRHTSPPTERDFAVQHPVSVHNWLLRNKPQIKQEQDQCSERGEAGPTTGGGKKKGNKREKTKEDAPFDALDDEIGFDAASEEHFGKSKRKSKGDGDHTYRPKGGRSKAKRKRDRGDEGDGEGKETKKYKSSATVDADGDYGDV